MTSAIPLKQILIRIRSCLLGMSFINTHDLAYYFGPIRWQVTAWDYQGQFEQLLQAAVQQRPSIVDYQLTVQYLPLSAIPWVSVLLRSILYRKMSRSLGGCGCDDYFSERDGKAGVLCSTIALVHLC